MAYFFKWQNLLKTLNGAFSVSAGHDHDGTNSKAVTVTGISAGAITADAAGRAMMADDYFNAATVLAKFDADSFDNAQILLAFKDGSYNADAGTRALFDDGIWTLAKLDAGARAHILPVQIPALAANVDMADFSILVVPASHAITLTKVSIVSNGTAVGIDDSNKCTLLVEDSSSNAIVTKEFDTDPAFPALGTAVDLGALDATHKILAAGEKLFFSVTNGTTAATPAFLLQIEYTIAAA